MRFLKILPLVFLVACTAAGPDFKIPTELPTREFLDDNYGYYKHDLSKFPNYHFRVFINEDWVTLDTKLETEPVKDQFQDIAIFRQRGEWMERETVQPKAEIVVSVINVEGDTKSPKAIMENIFKGTVVNYDVLDEHVVNTKYGEAADTLLSYMNGAQKVIMRVAAFRVGDRLFVIMGSDDIAEFKEHQTDFDVAIHSMQPEGAKADETNPFLEIR